MHRFRSANAKIEQRFKLGNGARRFTVSKAALRESAREALRDFWETQYGPYGAFTYNAPNDDGNGTTAYVCRFENEPLSWERLSDEISSSGATLIEIPQANQLTGPNSFSTLWSMTGTLEAAATAVTAPDGSAAAWKLQETSVIEDSRWCARAASITLNRRYCLSYWLKQGERRYVRIQVQDGSTHHCAWFDLQTGQCVDVATYDTVWHEPPASVTYGIQDCGGGWYRVWISGIGLATGTGYVYVTPMHNYTIGDPTTGSPYAGTVGSGFYVWMGMFHECVGSPSDFAGPYTLNSTVTRFPSAGLETALLSQVQEIIPLVKIQPRAAGYPAIYVSDRRCTVGSQDYLPRLLGPPDGISQSCEGDADQAQFTLGNADRVMRDLVNDVDLKRSAIEFSLYHVGTGIKLDLWKGEVNDWVFDAGAEFVLTAVDGLYDLNLPYPNRRISRTCWKMFDTTAACPYTTEGSLDLVHFPNASAASCDKGLETDNGCMAHSMNRYFGGVPAEPQSMLWTKNLLPKYRDKITPLTSIIADSLFDRALPEIYTDDEYYTDKDGNNVTGMPVNCLMAAGREEGGRYQALGVVGAGPITLHSDRAKYFLDGQHNDGYPDSDEGLWKIGGTDPAGVHDFFSLAESGDMTQGVGFPFVYVAPFTWKNCMAAGVAAVVMRRGDQEDVQLSRPTEHSLVAGVLYGLEAWVWTAPATRLFTNTTNPVWIVVNSLLRARGLQSDPDPTAAEALFDVEAAVAAAAICDTIVDQIIGTETETQFKFRGVIADEKPLRDWIQDILTNCLGFYSFAFGKLKIGIRVNSSAVEAFTAGNIVMDSLRLAPLKPAYNHLTAGFADREFDFMANSLCLYDLDHAKLIGGATSPLYLKATLNLAGTANKSQAARIVTTRLREELGGISAAEWKVAREISFRTTVLALNVEPGMICSMTHEDMPDGWLSGTPTANYGEFRVASWRLNSDYSIDISGKSTFDSMYNLAVGPKPADVLADALPEEDIPIGDHGNPSGAMNLAILTTVDDAKIPLHHIACELNRDTENAASLIGLAVYGSPALPAQGIYDVERAAHPSTVLEEGDCYVTPGRKQVFCFKSNGDPRDPLADVVGRLFLAFTNDGDLAGQIIDTEGQGYVKLLDPFIRGGEFSYAIVKRPWDIGVDTTNTFFKWFEISQLGGGKQAHWRTPPIEIPQGTHYITAYARNLFGVGTRLTSGPVTVFYTGDATIDQGHPSGSSGLQILTSEDEAWIPDGHVAFRFNRDLENYKSIRWIWAVLGDTSPFHGPYLAQRTAHPADVLASGSGVTVTAGDVIIPLTISSPAPPALNGKVLLTWQGTGDNLLAGDIIKTHEALHLEMWSGFISGGVRNWAVVEPWWTLNQWEHVFSVPADLHSGSIDEVIWTTNAVKGPIGTKYAQVYTRNLFGMSDD